MGYSSSAISKGVEAELLAKLYFKQQGFHTLTPDTHETHYDFVIALDGDFTRVQVKAAIEVPKFDLMRVRNKHGQNRSYHMDDYDILAGVWVERKRIFLFRSEEVNNRNLGEQISLCSISGRPIRDYGKRYKPYFEGEI